MSAAAEGSAPAAAALARALGEAGLACEIEGRERLAVLRGTAPDAALLADPAQRELALRLAAAHGFTHVALELVDDGVPDPAGAPDSSDLAPHAPTRAPLPRA